MIVSFLTMIFCNFIPNFYLILDLMFWWLCGDFSNMRGAIFGKSKPHHHDDCGKRKETIDEQQFASIFTYNTAVNYASNKYGAFGKF